MEFRCSLRYCSFSATGFTLSIGVKAEQLDITIATPQSFEGLTQGLLGVFNGNKSDDLTPPGGTPPLDPTANESTIFSQFGEKCKYFDFVRTVRVCIPRCCVYLLCTCSRVCVCVCVRLYARECTCTRTCVHVCRVYVHVHKHCYIIPFKLP